MSLVSPRSALYCALFAAAMAVFQSSPAGSASPLAEINAQIARYGCNLPQYADSVPACRELHAQARALVGGGQPRYVPAPSYVAPASPPPQPQRSGGFFSNIFGFAPSSPSYQVSPYQPSSPQQGWDSSGEPKQSHTFRTLCVRTCDGYYYPISYSTVRSRFANDEQICKASCQSEVKLYVHPNPGADVDQAVTAKGERYTDLPNAFRYRDQLVADCKCKPDPWTDEAQLIFAQRALGTDVETQVAAAAGSPVAQASDGTTAPQGEWAASVAAAPVLHRPEASHPAFRKNGFFSWLAGF